MYRPLPYHYPPPTVQVWWKHPAAITIGVVFGWVLVTMLWKLLLVLGVMAGVGWGLWKLTLRIDQRHLEKVQARQALEARAEYEHWRLMHGDTRIGVYGRFPPAL